MENLVHRSGFEVAEPFRRFLQGDVEAWLRMEQYRDGNTLVIRTDLPGVDPEKDVDITEDRLQIDARREEPGHKDQAGYRSELRSGEFSRSIPLPRGIPGRDRGHLPRWGSGSPGQASGAVRDLRHHGQGLPPREPIARSPGELYVTRCPVRHGAAVSRKHRAREMGVPPMGAPIGGGRISPS